MMASSNGTFSALLAMCVRGIHRAPVNSARKGQWRRALMSSLICAWINGWVYNCEAGDLRRHRAHYDVTVMNWWGERMGYGGLPIPDPVCPVPDVYIYYVPDIINVWDTVPTFIHLPWMFLPTDILFWATDWIIQDGPPLYQISILNLG